MKKMLFLAPFILLVTVISPPRSAAQQAKKSVLVIQCSPGGVQVYVDNTLMGTTSAQGRLRLLLEPISRSGFDRNNLLSLHI